MERGTAIAIGAGVVVIGAGTYLYFAHKNGWWPFKRGEGQQPPPSPPGQPTYQVNVIDQNTAEVTVSWSPVQGATYYQVYVDGKIAASNVQGTSHKLTLKPGQTYQIQVAACN